MTDMKISHAVVWLCLGCAVIAECVHLEPTLDEAIDALPDEWGPHFYAGASSNNYAVLDRVIAETNMKLDGDTSGFFTYLLGVSPM